MKIDEAIKLTEFLFVRRPNLIDKDYDAAIKLGIEALKRVQLHRNDHFSSYPTLLPGETPIPDLSPSADRKQRLRESPLGGK